MNRLGIQSLNAGAPDLRLTGDQTQRGTYTQRRRNQMAYGGIAGLDGRKKYGIGSWFQENIMDPLKGLGGKNPIEIENESQQRVDREQGIVREGAKSPGDYPSGFDPTTMRLDDWATIGPKEGTGPYTPFYEQIFDPIRDAYNNQDNALGFNVGDIFGLGKEQYGKYTIPMGIGAAMGKLQQDYLDKQPPFPGNETGLDLPAIRKAALAGPEAQKAADLHFGIDPKYTTAYSAEGGRIGYAHPAGIVSDRPKGLGGLNLNETKMDTGRQLMLKQLEEIKRKRAIERYERERMEMSPEDFLDMKRQLRENLPSFEDIKRNIPEDVLQSYAQGGRIGYKGAGSVGIENLLQNLSKEEIEELLRMMSGNAQGGRIGSRNGGNGDHPLHDDYWEEFDPDRDQEEAMNQMQDIEGQMAGGEYNRAMELMLKLKENIPLTDEEKEELKGLMQTLLLAKGGRVAAQEGGLMDLGGMEKDYRQDGGFVPIGGEEKADDVPARLSKNEFVFTADAVKAAGGGDIDEGAQRMYNVMKNLEAGGQISEQSQGKA